MPQPTMDEIREILENLLVKKGTRETELSDFQEIARTKLDHVLIQKIFRGYPQQQKHDGLLSISLSYFSAKSKEPLVYASGARDPLRSQEEVTPETLYNLASISKFILMVMILRLVQAKKFSLESTLSQLLPTEAIPNAEKIRVSDLLAHRSGLRDAGSADIKESDQLAALIKVPEEQNHFSQSLYGSFYYARINYVIIAKLIQKETRQSLQESFMALVGTPLNISNIAVIDEGKSTLKHAVGYKPDGSKQELKDVSESYIYGSSGFRGTPASLVKLIFNFFTNNEFINPHYRDLVLQSIKEETFEVVTKENIYRWPIRTGLGIEERQLNTADRKGLRLYCHGGWQDSNAAFLVFNPADGTAYCCCVSKTQGLDKVYQSLLQGRQNERSPFNMPLMGLGCSSLTRESASIIDDAIRSGVYSFDTADCYQGGDSERVLGEKLKVYPRNKIFIASKVGVLFRGGEPELCGDPAYIKEAFSASLKRLQTDYLDLCYLHRIDPKVPLERSITALSELVKAGRIRFLGLSEATVSQIKRAHKIHPISAVQIEYSPWSRHDEKSGVIELCRELGITLVAYSPLGRGFFTQKDLEYFNQLPPRDYRMFLPRYTGDNLKHNYELRNKIQLLALKKGCTLAQLVMAWELNKGFVLIPATNNLEHLRENVAALRVKLNESEMAAFDELLESSSFMGPRYPNERVSAIYPEASPTPFVKTEVLLASLGLLGAVGLFAYNKYVKNKKTGSNELSRSQADTGKPASFIRSRL